MPFNTSIHKPFLLSSIQTNQFKPEFKKTPHTIHQKTQTNQTRKSKLFSFIVSNFNPIIIVLMKEDQIQPQKNLPFYWGTTPENEYYTQKQIKSTKSYFTTSSNKDLFTRSWYPLYPPRGIICMVHGLGNDISWTFQETPIYLAQNGYSCFAIDLPGHGNSQGLKAFLPNVDEIVDDCYDFFISIKQKNPNFEKVPIFLYGESMGGAICLLISLKYPNFFKGGIFLAPMCKISDKIKPRFPIPEILTFLGKFVPTLPIVPTPDLLEKSVKIPEKKEIAAKNPLRYTGKPRLGTVLELLRVTDYLSKRLCDVTIPFIVIHGDADVVTDPEVSKELFAAAKSEDKMIKVYDGMVHSLLFGESDENVELVRKDVLNWLNDRCKGVVEEEAA